MVCNFRVCCALRAVCDKRTSSWSGLWLHWWPCFCPVTLPVHQHVQAQQRNQARHTHTLQPHPNDCPNFSAQALPGLACMCCCARCITIEEVGHETTPPTRVASHAGESMLGGWPLPATLQP